MFGSDGKRFVRCKNEECLSPQCVKKTVKFEVGSIMVWGMVSSVGVGPIVHFHGNINASVYKEFLCQHTLPHLCKGTVETPILMQDNAPCHKTEPMWSFLEEDGIAVMKWPPQSQDINPIVKGVSSWCNGLSDGLRSYSKWIRTPVALLQSLSALPYTLV